MFWLGSAEGGDANMNKIKATREPNFRRQARSYVSQVMKAEGYDVNVKMAERMIVAYYRFCGYYLFNFGQLVVPLTYPDGSKSWIKCLVYIKELKNKWGHDYIKIKHKFVLFKKKELFNMLKIDDKQYLCPYSRLTYDFDPVGAIEKSHQAFRNNWAMKHYGIPKEFFINRVPKDQWLEKLEKNFGRLARYRAIEEVNEKIIGKVIKSRPHYVKFRESKGYGKYEYVGEIEEKKDE